ncbi:MULTISPECIES: helix-turn-helix domain-containing protein [Halomonas]|uniref:Transcriptional regulator n=1 Tax=Halomonas halophila TaxID=29573 RepID=A0ABQ0U6P4_9GAMM|nr:MULTISPECIES: helix-turn-helix domain-containing protein [Halomonas]MDR5888420.1 helix-turn-helix domain-containing protein [Halomonas salina]WJY05763.1 helix-turn-helix domain-containing protein [Halomonas halophila]GEK74142.1 transcriptional regulator [Halomonas halophila]
MKITSPDMLAHSLKNARKRRQLTQQATAEQIGIKQATVSGFEHHPERSRLETLFKLLSALELELHVTERDSTEESASPEACWDQEW